MLIELEVESEESEYFQLIENSLYAILKALPDEAYFGLIGFSSHLIVYDLNKSFDVILSAERLFISISILSDIAYGISNSVRQ